MSEAKETVEL